MRAESLTPSVGFTRAQAFFQSLPHTTVLGVELVSFDNNVALARLPYSPELVGNPWSGTVHGGAITTLIEQVSGAAVVARLPNPEAVATLDLRIDSLRTARPHEPLYARAECYRITSNIAFARCDVYQRGVSSIASSISSFMLTVTARQAS